MSSWLHPYSTGPSGAPVNGQIQPIRSRLLTSKLRWFIFVSAIDVYLHFSTVLRYKFHWSVRYHKIIWKNTLWKYFNNCRNCWLCRKLVAASRIDSVGRPTLPYRCHPTLDEEIESEPAVNGNDGLTLYEVSPHKKNKSKSKLKRVTKKIRQDAEKLQIRALHQWFSRTFVHEGNFPVDVESLRRKYWPRCGRASGHDIARGAGCLFHQTPPQTTPVSKYNPHINWAIIICQDCIFKSTFQKFPVKLYLFL